MTLFKIIGKKTKQNKTKKPNGVEQEFPLYE